MEILKDLKYKDLNVIGQSADRAVIFCYHRPKRRIICFDQHAAHERINFEQLLDESDLVEDLDKIKSKACHSAIKVGRKLAINECQDLIERLLRCKIPTRCAHSRCGACVLESLDKILFMEQVRSESTTNDQSASTSAR